MCVCIHSITTCLCVCACDVQGFLNIKWAKWKRLLLTRSIAIVPCIIIAILARNSLDYLDDYINVEQSLLVSSYLQLLYSTIYWLGNYFS